MRKLVLKTIIVSMILSCAGWAYSQESKWEKLNNRFNEMFSQGNYLEAINVAKRSRNNAKKKFGREDKRYRQSTVNLVRAHEAQARKYDAENNQFRAKEYYNKAFEIASKDYPQDDLLFEKIAARLVEFYFYKNDYDEAMRYSEQALNLVKRLAGKDKDLRLVRLYSDLARMYHERGNYCVAVSYRDSAYQAAKRAYANNHLKMNEYLKNYTAVLMVTADYRTAENLYREALSNISHSHENEIESLEIQYLGSLAGVLILQGSIKAGESRYRQAIEKADSPFVSKNIPLPDYWNALATICVIRAKFDEAKYCYNMALEVQSVPILKAQSYSGLAGLHVARGELDDAVICYQNALDCVGWSSWPSKGDISLAAGYLNGLAMVYMRQKEYGKAEKTLRNALEKVDWKSGKDNFAAAICLQGLASLLMGQNKFSEAADIYQDALHKIDWSSMTAAEYRVGLARVHAAQKDFSGAKENYDKAIDIAKRKYGLFDLRIERFLSGRAGIFMTAGKFDDADYNYALIFDALEKACIRNPYRRLNYLIARAKIRRAQENYEGAAGFYKQAILALEGREGPDLRTAENLCNELVQIYNNLGDKEQADRFEKRAAQFRSMSASNH